MDGGAEHLRPTILVTLEAGFKLGALDELVLDRNLFHDLVAIGAGETARSCTLPANCADRPFRAGQADRVALVDGRGDPCGRNDVPAAPPSISLT